MPLDRNQAVAHIARLFDAAGVLAFENAAHAVVFWLVQGNPHEALEEMMHPCVALCSYQAKESSLYGERPGARGLMIRDKEEVIRVQYNITQDQFLVETVRSTLARPQVTWGRAMHKRPLQRGALLLG